MTEPAVSVVIPTYNRRRQLEQTLAGLARQTYSRDLFETIVVSDGSTDDTEEYLASGDLPLRVVAVTQPNAGPAAARNHGVGIARGQLIVFIDDDIVPAPGCLARHVERHDPLDDDRVVVGPMLDPPDHEMSPWIDWEQRMLYKQYEGMVAGRFEPSPRQFYTGNASIARRHVLAAGGFNTSFRRAEDIELAYRLHDRGLLFVFEPAAIAHHYAERSFDSWRRIAYDYGRMNVIFGRDLGRSWILVAIGKEFGDRHVLARALTLACIPRPWLRRPVDTSLRLAARVAARLRFPRIAKYALSAIYSIEYHDGVADELGGAEQFRAILQPH
jgi:GT2 family glycosyltransferase